MKRFTSEEMAYLANFEKNFSCVLDSHYLRGASMSDVNKMVTIWERVADSPYRMNHDCGKCVYDFLSLIGAEYRKQKTMPAEGGKGKNKKSK